MSCSGLYPVSSENLQGWSLNSFSRQPAPTGQLVHGKTFFLMHSWNLSCFGLCLLFFILLPCATVKSLATSSSLACRHSRVGSPETTSSPAQLLQPLLAGLVLQLPTILVATILVVSLVVQHFL